MSKSSSKPRIWLGLTVEDGGKFYSWAHQVPCGDDLKSFFGMVAHLQTATAFPTRKAACEAVAAWNEAYRRNGTFMFAGDDQPF